MNKNLKVKTVQFAVGVDLLGSKMTLSARNGTILEEVGDGMPGIIAYSTSTGRAVKIPMTNIKGIEYFPVAKEAPKVKEIAKEK